jgi:hypothetical protein
MSNQKMLDQDYSNELCPWVVERVVERVNPVQAPAYFDVYPAEARHQQKISTSTTRNAVASAPTQQLHAALPRTAIVISPQPTSPDQVHSTVEPPIFLPKRPRKQPLTLTGKPLSISKVG